jgi:hypothetical protein
MGRGSEIQMGCGSCAVRSRSGFRGNERTGADEAVTYLNSKAAYLDYATGFSETVWNRALSRLSCRTIRLYLSSP